MARKKIRKDDWLLAPVKVVKVHDDMNPPRITIDMPEYGTPITISLEFAEEWESLGQEKVRG